MTHAFLRAVGFKKAPDRKKLKKLITHAVRNPKRRQYGTADDGIIEADFSVELGNRIGVTVCGSFDPDNSDSFLPDFFFPYLDGSVQSTTEDISAEAHSFRRSYAGVCDDLRLGVSLIFFLKNRIQIMRLKALDRDIPRDTPVKLCALAREGSVLMPLFKGIDEREKGIREGESHMERLMAARDGDEDAIEDLTLEDMDMYTTISRKLKTEDVYTLVDTCFIPYGVECDQYSILGEILRVEKTLNHFSEEEVYIMRLSCNDMEFDLCINREDLYGDPQPGRRFKGTVWMQGEVVLEE